MWYGIELGGVSYLTHVKGHLAKYYTDINLRARGTGNENLRGAVRIDSHNEASKSPSQNLKAHGYEVQYFASK